VTEQPRKRAPRKTAAAKPTPEVSDQVQDQAEVDNTTAEQPAETAQAAKAPPSVQAVGDWQLVTHGTWQISVGPDGLLMLPRHLHPHEVDDFIAAATIAKQVGADVIAANNHKARKDNRRLSTRRGAIVTEGEPPAGTVRMNVSQQQAAATIGRPRRGQRPANPMTSGRAVG
jgi:outer membrane biosynthesis protein TonB